MKTADASPRGAAVRDGLPADAVLRQLGKVLASPEFSGARSRARFLEYIVTRTLAGEEDTLTHHDLAVDAPHASPAGPPTSLASGRAR